LQKADTKSKRLQMYACTTGGTQRAIWKLRVYHRWQTTNWTC